MLPEIFSSTPKIKTVPPSHSRVAWNLAAHHISLGGPVCGAGEDVGTTKL